jgi:hypothetical protein
MLERPRCQRLWRQRNDVVLRVGVRPSFAAGWRPVLAVWRFHGAVRGACALALPLLAVACGRVDTVVGAEFAPDAGGAPVVATDASGEAGPACTGDLSGIGTADFRISLTVVSTQTGVVALVNQRQQCAPSVFWDIRMVDGHLDVEVDDVASYTKIMSTGAPINDGLPHDIAVQRSAGTVTVTIDGADAGSEPSAASLGALPPLASGTDVCVTSSDGTVDLVGEISNVCVAR